MRIKIIPDPTAAPEEPLTEFWLREDGDAIHLCARRNGVVGALLMVNESGVHRWFGADGVGLPTDVQGRIKDATLGTP